MPADIHVGPEPIDPAALMEAVRRDGSGALASFVGVVRDNDGGRPVRHLVYEAYAPMAEQEMSRIAQEMLSRWELSAVAMHHRTGKLEIGEASVAIVVSAPHRAAALEACAFGVEQLKRTVPIWKKEFTGEGGEWIIGDPSREG